MVPSMGFFLKEACKQQQVGMHEQSASATVLPSSPLHHTENAQAALICKNQEY
jgi:hypothetical protein